MADIRPYPRDESYWDRILANRWRSRLGGLQELRVRTRRESRLPVFIGGTAQPYVGLGSVTEGWLVDIVARSLRDCGGEGVPMYVPRHFVEADEGYVTDFIRKHAFGTLVSWDGQRPVASQLLFNLVGRAGSEKLLFGHMARSNPQWKSFNDAQEVLAIFQGPHACVSAAWYSVQSAPTWNYVTVQVYGHVQVIEDGEELYRELGHLVASQEGGSPEGEQYNLESMPADLREGMMKAIVGFHIRISRIDCAAKLSQNRSDRDQEHIISKLTERGDASSLSVAKEMQTRRIEGTPQVESSSPNTDAEP